MADLPTAPLLPRSVPAGLASMTVGGEGTGIDDEEGAASRLMEATPQAQSGCGGQRRHGRRRQRRRRGRRHRRLCGHGTGGIGWRWNLRRGRRRHPDKPLPAYFDGDVDVLGTLSKSSGSFKIDHPLDPANKYLYHSFVESPDMKNIYDGNVTTDGSGTAIVTMPAWFEALNTDFRYQLTVIGQLAQAIVASEISKWQLHHQDQQAGREGFLAGHRHPSGRLGQRASHPGGSGQSARRTKATTSIPSYSGTRANRASRKCIIPGQRRQRKNNWGKRCRIKND